MVNNCDLVLWLNKETLEEVTHPKGSVVRGIDWVQVPDGATFATGHKDHFVFRKDRAYYDCDGWIASNVTLDILHIDEFLKLFWVKSSIKNPKDKIQFTLDRLLGCEVLFDNESYFVKYVYYTHQIGRLVLENDKYTAFIGDFSCLTFFTEDGDELTFDEYVAMYYGD